MGDKKIIRKLMILLPPGYEPEEVWFAVEARCETPLILDKEAIEPALTPPEVDRKGHVSTYHPFGVKFQKTDFKTVRT